MRRQQDWVVFKRLLLKRTVTFTRRTKCCLLVLPLRVMENSVTSRVTFEEFIDGFINVLVQAQ